MRGRRQGQISQTDESEDENPIPERRQTRSAASLSQTENSNSESNPGSPSKARFESPPKKSRSRPRSRGQTDKNAKSGVTDVKIEPRQSRSHSGQTCESGTNKNQEEGIANRSNRNRSRSRRDDRATENKEIGRLEPEESSGYQSDHNSSSIKHARSERSVESRQRSRSVDRLSKERRSRSRQTSNAKPDQDRRDESRSPKQSTRSYAKNVENISKQQQSGSSPQLKNDAIDQNDKSPPKNSRRSCARSVDRVTKLRQNASQSRQEDKNEEAPVQNERDSSPEANQRSANRNVALVSRNRESRSHSRQEDSVLESPERPRERGRRRSRSVDRYLKMNEMKSPQEDKYSGYESDHSSLSHQRGRSEMKESSRQRSRSLDRLSKYRESASDILEGTSSGTTRNSQNIGKINKYMSKSLRKVSPNKHPAVTTMSSCYILDTDYESPDYAKDSVVVVDCHPDIDSLKVQTFKQKSTSQTRQFKPVRILPKGETLPDTVSDSNTYPDDGADYSDRSESPVEEVGEQLECEFCPEAFKSYSDLEDHWLQHFSSLTKLHAYLNKQRNANMYNSQPKYSNSVQSSSGSSPTNSKSSPKRIVSFSASLDKDSHCNSDIIDKEKVDELDRIREDSTESEILNQASMVADKTEHNRKYGKEHEENVGDVTESEEDEDKHSEASSSISDAVTSVLDPFQDDTSSSEANSVSSSDQEHQNEECDVDSQTDNEPNNIEPKNTGELDEDINTNTSDVKIIDSSTKQCDFDYQVELCKQKTLKICMKKLQPKDYRQFWREQYGYSSSDSTNTTPDLQLILNNGCASHIEKATADMPQLQESSILNVNDIGLMLELCRTNDVGHQKDIDNKNDNSLLQSDSIVHKKDELLCDQFLDTTNQKSNKDLNKDYSLYKSQNQGEKPHVKKVFRSAKAKKLAEERSRQAKVLGKSSNNLDSVAKQVSEVTFETSSGNILESVSKDKISDPLQTVNTSIETESETSSAVENTQVKDKLVLSGKTAIDGERVTRKSKEVKSVSNVPNLKENVEELTRLETKCDTVDGEVVSVGSTISDQIDVKLVTNRTTSGRNRSKTKKSTRLYSVIEPTSVVEDKTKNVESLRNKETKMSSVPSAIKEMLKSPATPNLFLERQGVAGDTNQTDVTNQLDCEATNRLEASPNVTESETCASSPDFGTKLDNLSVLVNSKRHSQRKTVRPKRYEDSVDSYGTDCKSFSAKLEFQSDTNGATDISVGAILTEQSISSGKNNEQNNSCVSNRDTSTDIYDSDHPGPSINTAITRVRKGRKTKLCKKMKDRSGDSDTTLDTGDKPTRRERKSKKSKASKKRSSKPVFNDHSLTDFTVESEILVSESEDPFLVDQNNPSVDRSALNALLLEDFDIVESNSFDEMESQTTAAQMQVIGPLEDSQDDCNISPDGSDMLQKDDLPIIECLALLKKADPNLNDGRVVDSSWDKPDSIGISDSLTASPIAKSRRKNTPLTLLEEDKPSSPSTVFKETLMDQENNFEKVESPRIKLFNDSDVPVLALPVNYPSADLFKEALSSTENDSTYHLSHAESVSSSPQKQTTSQRILHRCEVCNMRFKSVALLQAHAAQLLHDTSTFLDSDQPVESECQLCKAQFQSEQELTAHKDICGEASPNKATHKVGMSRQPKQASDINSNSTKLDLNNMENSKDDTSGLVAAKFVSYPSPQKKHGIYQTVPSPQKKQNVASPWTPSPRKKQNEASPSTPSSQKKQNMAISLTQSPQKQENVASFITPSSQKKQNVASSLTHSPQKQENVASFITPSSQKKQNVASSLTRSPQKQENVASRSTPSPQKKQNETSSSTPSPQKKQKLASNITLSLLKKSDIIGQKDPETVCSRLTPLTSRIPTVLSPFVTVPGSGTVTKGDNAVHTGTAEDDAVSTSIGDKVDIELNLTDHSNNIGDFVHGIHNEMDDALLRDIGKTPCQFCGKKIKASKKDRHKCKTSKTNKDSGENSTNSMSDFTGDKFMSMNQSRPNLKIRICGNRIVTEPVVESDKVKDLETKVEKEKQNFRKAEFADYDSNKSRSSQTPKGKFKVFKGESEMKIILKKVQFRTFKLNGLRLKFCGSPVSPRWKLKSPKVDLEKYPLEIKNNEEGNRKTSESDTSGNLGKNSDTNTKKTHQVRHGHNHYDNSSCSNGTKDLSHQQYNTTTHNKKSNNKNTESKTKSCTKGELTDFELAILSNAKDVSKNKIKKSKKHSEDKVLSRQSSLEPDHPSDTNTLQESNRELVHKKKAKNRDADNAAHPFHNSKTAQRIYMEAKRKAAHQEGDPDFPDISGSKINVDTLQPFSEMLDNKKEATKKNNSSKSEKSELCGRSLKSDLESIGIVSSKSSPKLKDMMSSLPFKTSFGMLKSPFKRSWVGDTDQPLKKIPKLSGLAEACPTNKKWPVFMQGQMMFKSPLDSCYTDSHIPHWDKSELDSSTESNLNKTFPMASTPFNCFNDKDFSPFKLPNEKGDNNEGTQISRDSQIDSKKVETTTTNSRTSIPDKKKTVKTKIRLRRLEVPGESQMTTSSQPRQTIFSGSSGPQCEEDDDKQSFKPTPLIIETSEGTTTKRTVTIKNKASDKTNKNLTKDGDLKNSEYELAICDSQTDLDYDESIMGTKSRHPSEISEPDSYDRFLVTRSISVDRSIGDIGGLDSDINSDRLREPVDNFSLQNTYREQSAPFCDILEKSNGNKNQHLKKISCKLRNDSYKLDNVEINTPSPCFSEQSIDESNDYEGESENEVGSDQAFSQMDSETLRSNRIKFVRKNESGLDNNDQAGDRLPDKDDAASVFDDALVLCDRSDHFGDCNDDKVIGENGDNGENSDNVDDDMDNDENDNEIEADNWTSGKDAIEVTESTAEGLTMDGVPDVSKDDDVLSLDYEDDDILDLFAPDDASFLDCESVLEEPLAERDVGNDRRSPDNVTRCSSPEDMDVESQSSPSHNDGKIEVDVQDQMLGGSGTQITSKGLWIPPMFCYKYCNKQPCSKNCRFRHVFPDRDAVLKALPLVAEAYKSGKYESALWMLSSHDILAKRLPPADVFNLFRLTVRHRHINGAHALLKLMYNRQLNVQNTIDEFIQQFAADSNSGNYLWDIFLMSKSLNMQLTQPSNNSLLRRFKESRAWRPLWEVLLYLTECETYSVPLQYIHTALQATVENPEVFLQQTVSWLYEAGQDLLKNLSVNLLQAMCDILRRHKHDKLSETLEELLRSRDKPGSIGSSRQGTPLLSNPRQATPLLSNPRSGPLLALGRSRSATPPAQPVPFKHVRNQEELGEWDLLIQNIQSVQYLKSWDYLGELFVDVLNKQMPPDTALLSEFFKTLSKDPSLIATGFKEFVLSVKILLEKDKKMTPKIFKDLSSLSSIGNELIFFCHTKRLWKEGCELICFQLKQGILCFKPANMVARALEICVNAHDSILAQEVLQTVDIGHIPAEVQNYLLDVFPNLIELQLKCGSLTRSYKLLTIFFNIILSDKSGQLLNRKSSILNHITVNLFRRCAETNEWQMAISIYKLYCEHSVPFNVHPSLKRYLLVITMTKGYKEDGFSLYNDLKKNELYVVQSLDSPRMIVLNKWLTRPEVYLIVRDYLFELYNYFCDQIMENRILNQRDLDLGVIIGYSGPQQRERYLTELGEKEITDSIVQDILQHHFDPPLQITVSNRDNRIYILQQSLEVYLQTLDNLGRKQGLLFQQHPKARLNISRPNISHPNINQPNTSRRLPSNRARLARARGRGRMNLYRS